MTSLFNIGVGALNANKSRLNTAGNNIANASTPGYSRQEVLTTSAETQRLGGSYIGSGVAIEGIRRSYDSYLSLEMRTNTSSFEQYDALVNEINKVDNFIGDDAVGLSPSLQQFFAAMQDAANNPQSTASRQTLLTKSELLVNRFHSTSTRLDEISDSVNTQLTNTATELNTLTSNLARLNVQINNAGGSGIGSQPNDLLDKRDQLLLKLSELVAVNTTENANGSVNVFVGNGQALVIGNQAFSMSVQPQLEDPRRIDLVLNQGSTSQVVTDGLSGGRLGGLLDFSSNTLYDAYDQLGRVSVALNVAINEQHRNGMNLNNDSGIDFFTDVNSTARQQARVIANPDNSSLSTGQIEVAIDDISELTSSAYRVQMSATNARQYTVTRLSDGEEIAQSLLPLTLPTTINFDGLEVSFASGTFQTGDQFTLYPTRFESAALQLQVSDVDQLAFAQPIKTSATLGNLGNGVISAGEVTDASTDSFDLTNQQMAPPLLIRFITRTTYEVLDNSDPSNPVELDPPLSNQRFVAGISNPIFPTAENETAVSTTGTEIGVPQISASANGYSAEAIQFTRIDPDTQQITLQTVTTTANDSAQTIAAAFNNVTGVSATAITRATLSNIQSTTPLNLTFNGQLLTGFTPSALAASINANTVLTQQGVRATSDGARIFIASNLGVDFNFQLGGASANDSMDVTGMEGSTVQIDALDATPAVTIGGRVDLVMDDGVSVQGRGNLIESIPTARQTDRGYQVSISGQPSSGDTFQVNYNTNGFADNRNAVAMAAIQNRNVLQSGTVTLQGAVANVVNQVANRSQETSINRDASETLLTQVQQARAEVSGVNLDEEAAKLIQFENAYSASAQLITVARNLFDTLLNAVG
jgi:flagellar hook-associated protein 1 FlgK